MVETIICAAIWYKDQPTAKILPINIKQGVVICGHRHPHCIHTFIALTGKRSVLPECGEYVQGFLTIKNRFVNRMEAMELAFQAGQVTKEKWNTKKELFSEDLY